MASPWRRLSAVASDEGDIVIDGGLLANPIFQTGLLPGAAGLIVGGIVIGGLRAARAPEQWDRLAFLCVPLAFVLAYLLVQGAPRMPPVAATQKLFYLALLALVVGVGLDATRASRGTGWIAVLGFLAVSVLWLGWHRLLAGPDAIFALKLALLWLAAVLVLARLSQARSPAALNGAVMVGLAAIGTSMVALIGASASLAQLSGAIGTGVLGLAVWFWVRWAAGARSAPPGTSGLLGAAALCLAVVDVMVLYSPNVALGALAILLLVFGADMAAGRIGLGQGVGARVLAPVVTGAIGIIPVVAAVGAAYLLAGGFSFRSY